MYSLQQRFMQSRLLLLVAVGCVALLLLLAFSTLTIRNGAAHPATSSDAVTLTFTATIAGGTPPSNVVFWVCPDAQADGTGCEKMTAGANNMFTYQLASTTGTTYQNLTIEWSQGEKTGANGSIPAPPAHTVCDYANFSVTTSGPHSFSCPADFSAPTVTPVPSVTTTPAQTPSTSVGTDDNGTLITGLQIIIGVGLVLFIILLIILIWQRVSAPKKP